MYLFGKKKRHMRRGAMPTPRHILAGAEPHVALEVVPPNFITIPKQLSIWHNDTDGDCVTAEEAFAKACSNPEIFIRDDTVERWAVANHVLNGAFLYQVLELMRYGGFYQNHTKYNDGKAWSVDWTKPNILQSAISQGPVKIGVAADQLETACQSTDFASGWFATNFTADNNEDHCVSLCGYGTITWLFGQLGKPVPLNANGSLPGYALFTWGGIGVIDVASMLAITHEAWLRTPTTMIKI